MIPQKFADAISSVQPENLSNYLFSTGWFELDLEKNISIWHRREPQNESLELLQPKIKDFRDYSQRVYELIFQLSEFEKRSLDCVLSDLINFSADIVKIRISHDDVDNGSIPLDDGVTLFKNARELFISAVRSTFNKKKYFSGGHFSDEIQSFLNTLRFGQTERGSYIVNLIAPIPSQNEEQRDMHNVSLTRSITNTLAHSLTAIDVSITEYKKTNDITVFDHAVEKGVSANLCDAILGLSGENKIRNVDIKILLSRNELDRDEIKLNHLFHSSYLPYLEKASEYYKDTYVIPNITITGIVTKLTHEPDSDSGSITIDALIYDKQKNVTVELNISDYWEAHHAHRKKQPIEISGNLYITPKSAKLLESHSFRVFGSNDLFDNK